MCEVFTTIFLSLFFQESVPRSEMRLNSLSEDSPLEKVWQSMELHPEYYNAFQSTHNLLMGGSGTLNYTKRNYIAVMVGLTIKNENLFILSHAN